MAHASPTTMSLAPAMSDMPATAEVVSLP